MIWKITHLSVAGLAAENAYQSKNQALRSEEQDVVHGTDMKKVKKNIHASLKAPKNTVASIILK